MGSPLKFPVGCCSFRSKTTCNSASAIAVSSVYEEQSDTVDRFIESFGLDTALAGMGGTGGTTTGTQSSYSSELCDRLETAIDANDTDAASEMITLMASGEEPDPNDAATGNIVEPGFGCTRPWFWRPSRTKTRPRSTWLWTCCAMSARRCKGEWLILGLTAFGVALIRSRSESPSVPAAHISIRSNSDFSGRRAPSADHLMCRSR